MFPFLLGQAFLGGELGVSQGEDDPLTRVACASLLELAGLLERLDAGPPVSDPVLDPPQKLPARTRLRNKFNRLRNCLNRPFRIAALRVWAVDQVPTLLPKGNAEVLVSDDVFRVEFDRFAEALDGLVIISQFVAQVGAEVAVSEGGLRVEPDPLLEGGDGVIPLALARQGSTEAVVGL